MAAPRQPLETLAAISVESRIRRAAQKRGLRAVRSRWQAGTPLNEGGWQIVNGRGTIVAGPRFDLTAIAALRFLESR